MQIWDLIGRGGGRNCSSPRPTGMEQVAYGQAGASFGVIYTGSLASPGAGTRKRKLSLDRSPSPSQQSLTLGWQQELATTSLCSTAISAQPASQASPVPKPQCPAPAPLHVPTASTTACVSVETGSENNAPILESAAGSRGSGYPTAGVGKLGSSDSTVGHMDPNPVGTVSDAMALYLRLTAGANASINGGQRQQLAEGSRVWVKMPGYCHWPAVVFSLRCCRKAEVPELLASYQPGRILVHFYGSHDHTWANPASLTAWTTDRGARLAALKAAAKSSRVAATTVAELTGSLGANAASDPVRELARVVQLREAATGTAKLKGSSSGSHSAGKGYKPQCGGCGEVGTQVLCKFCHTAFHTLCLPQPDISPAHMLAVASRVASAGLLLGAPQQPPVRQPPQQQVLKVEWACGVCKRQNELKGPCPANGVPRTGIRAPGGSAGNSGRKTCDGSNLDRADNGRVEACMSNGRSSAAAIQAAPMDAQQQQALTLQRNLQPQPHEQPSPRTHADLLALYERLLEQDAVVAAVPAATAADTMHHRAGTKEMAEMSTLSPDEAGGPREGPHESTEKVPQRFQLAVMAAMLRPTLRSLPGTRLWVKTPGYCHWPAVVFSLRYCRKTEVPELLATYQPGHTLVHFYGEHNHLWLPDAEVAALAAASADPQVEEVRRAELLVWSNGRKKRAASGRTALAELEAMPLNRTRPAAAACSGDGIPVAAVSGPADTVAAPGQSPPAPPSPSSRTTQLPPTDPSREVLRVVALREARLAEEAELREKEAWELLRQGVCEGSMAGSRAGGSSSRGSGTLGPAGFIGERDKALTSASPVSHAIQVYTLPAAVGRVVDPEAGVGGWRSWLRACAACEEPGGQVTCSYCRLSYHTLCLTPRWLSPVYMPPSDSWTCASCGGENEAHSPSGGCIRSDDDVRGGKLEEERLGLTPDWIIVAGAFKVFQLPRPTASTPYIRGLLDPCTNSKANPNIPAEKLYDKEDDGLRLSNSWAGYYVILNPEYTSQTQWRFVNRAIDEVENGTVPAVLLLCRNSTDTAYFQRLRPYPRVMLKRTSARFKDYEKTPIGFGIAVFCIAPRGAGRAPLYRRFIDVFGDWGEPNIPIDSAFVDSPAFSELLDRLSDHTTRHLRDTWVQCSACRKWRIVPYEVYRRFCEQLSKQHGRQETGSNSERGGEGLLLPVGDRGGDGDGDYVAEVADDEPRQPAGCTWTCSQLGSGVSCDRPQSRVEAAGVHYARQRTSHRPGPRVSSGTAGQAGLAAQQQQGWPIGSQKDGKLEYDPHVAEAGMQEPAGKQAMGSDGQRGKLQAPGTQSGRAEGGPSAEMGLAGAEAYMEAVGQAEGPAPGEAMTEATVDAAGAAKAAAAMKGIAGGTVVSEY